MREKADRQNEETRSIALGSSDDSNVDIITRISKNKDANSQQVDDHRKNAGSSPNEAIEL